MNEEYRERVAPTTRERLEAKLKYAQEEVKRLETAIKFLDEHPGAVEFFNEYNKIVMR